MLKTMMCMIFDLRKIYNHFAAAGAPMMMMEDDGASQGRETNARCDGGDGTAYV